MKRSTPRAALAMLALGAALVGPGAVPSASAAQDTVCMRSGLRTLQEAGLLSTVARNGLPISVAVSLGVTPRAGTDVASLPDPLPLSLILADHRAGQGSLFTYPWC